MANFYLKYRDSLPILRLNAQDSNGYIDLSSYTSNLFIYQRTNRLNPPITGNVTVLGASSGFVEYQFTGSLISGGVYYGEFRFSGSNGQISIPNDGMILFSVQNGLY